MMKRIAREFWVELRADLLKFVRICDKQVAKIDGVERKEMLESTRYHRMMVQHQRKSQKTLN